MGHKKFSHSEEEIDSPKKIVLNNKLIKLKHEKYYVENEENCEYILTSNTGPNKGDSGHFLELCFNKFNNNSIFNLLHSLKKKGKLIKRPDLFINSEKLEKYVILRKIAEEKNIQLQFDDEKTIEEEIEYMNSIIDLEKYKNEQKIKEEEKKNKKSKNKLNKNKKYIKFFSKEKEGNYEKDFEEEEDSEENSEEKEYEKEDPKYMMILKKFKFKNDEELSFNVEQKLKETGLSQEDYNDLYFLYFKFLKKY